jgi:serine/threonine protein phosphatase 1
MATIAVGDIHGHLDALNEVLSLLAAELSQADTVVFLGDYIDRGPDSRGCVDRILEFSTATPATVIGLLGNHEEWLLRTFRDHTRHSWLLGMEAYQTIESYSPSAAQAIRTAAKAAGAALYQDHTELPYELFFEAVPASHMTFLENLRLYHLNQDALCVHGGLDPAAGGPEEQTQYSLVWGQNGFQSQYKGEDLLVYGHWHNTRLSADGFPQPLIVGRTVGIDTIGHGVLTALRLPDFRVFQSGQATSWVLDV